MNIRDGSVLRIENDNFQNLIIYFTKMCEDEFIELQRTELDRIE